MYAGNDISSAEKFCNPKKRKPGQQLNAPAYLFVKVFFFFFFFGVSNYSAQNIFISSQLEALDLCTVWNVIDFNP